MSEVAWLGLARAVLVAAACAAVAGCVTDGGHGSVVTCSDQKPKTVKLKIQFANGQGKVEHDDGHDKGKSADEVHACRGDTISWKADATEFELKFTDPKKQPFEWKDGKHRSKKNSGGKWELVDVVSDIAPQEEPLTYEVTTPGGTMDPAIIIDK